MWYISYCLVYHNGHTPVVENYILTTTSTSQWLVNRDGIPFPTIVKWVFCSSVTSFRWWTVHWPCSTLHYCQFLLSDCMKRHHPFILYLVRWRLLWMMSPPCSITLSSRFFITALINQEIACIIATHDLGLGGWKW